MKFTPVILVYIIVLAIAAVAVRKLNQCTLELETSKKKIRIQEQK